MPLSNKEFKKLESIWYAKAARSGFRDIENKSGRMDTDKALNNIVTKYTQTTYKAKEDYYRLAGQFLNDYAFKTKLERLVWEMHSEGVSIRNIVLAAKRKGFKAYRRKIHELLQKLVSEMTNAKK